MFLHSGLRLGTFVFEVTHQSSAIRKVEFSRPGKVLNGLHIHSLKFSVRRPILLSHLIYHPQCLVCRGCDTSDGRLSPRYYP